MPFQVIGLNHKVAPVEVRERFATYCVSGLPGADGDRIEAVSVLTCNRVEVYFSGEIEASRKLFADWAAGTGLPFAELEKYLYRFCDDGAIRHLFRVASGLDSMVLGENQILHQVKASYQAAIGAKCVGKSLHALFQKALEVGKRVRSETRISENTVSIASTAVELAQQIFGPLGDSRVLVIGAGEMASLVARHMKDRGAGGLVFTNRTLARAQELADQFAGSARPFEELPKLLTDADVVVSSTGAPRQILTRPMVEEALRQRRYRPLFFIDIAVPRDIEMSVGELENAFLYNVDDLQGVVDENIDLRRVEAEKVEAIIDGEIERFGSALRSFSVVPFIRRLRDHAERVRGQELEKLLRRHPELAPELRADLEQFSRQLQGKWLHHPIQALKGRGGNDPIDLQLLAEIFGLSEEELKDTPLISLLQAEEK